MFFLSRLPSFPLLPPPFFEADSLSPFCFSFLFLVDASCQAQGRARHSSPSDAGNRSSNRQGLEGIQTPSRRGGVRSVLQGRAHGCRYAVVSRSQVLGSLQDDRRVSLFLLSVLFEPRRSELITLSAVAFLFHPISGSRDPSSELSDDFRSF